MRLQRLRLQNVCQHEDLDWRFDRGLVGVFGPNGSGKSNALNVSCYAGITNDYSRHAQGKAGMIRQQAGEEGKSVIEVTFEHDGHTVKLERGLQKPSRHRLWIDEKTELRKANDIQVAIEETLGISRQLIDRYMFVGQNDLYAFLSDTPAIRAKSFAHLCNTTHAEYCWELLGEFIELDRELAASIVDNTDEIRGAIGELNIKLRRANEKIKELEPKILHKDTIAELQDEIDQWNELQRHSSQLDSLESREADLLQAAKDANRARKQAAQDLQTQEKVVENLAAEATDAQRRLDSHSSEMSLWVRKQKQVRRLKEAEKALASLPEVSLEQPEGDEEALRTELADLQAEARQIRKMLEALEDGQVAECPTCGTPMEELHDHVEEHRERLEEYLDPRTDTVREQLAAFAAYERAVDDHQLQQKTLQRDVDRARLAVKEFADVHCPTPIDEEALQETVRFHGEAKKVLKWNQDAHTDSHGKFERAKAKHQTAVQAVEGCRQRIEELSGKTTASRVAKAKEALAENTVAVGEFNRACATAENLEEFIEDRKEELKRVKAQLKRSKQARQWLRDLSDVRDEVMHRDKLPAVVHRNALLNMEEEINRNLEYFNSPYFVTTDDNLGFTAKFANGTVMPAAGLSGGQKVMLAMAFRLAVNSLFAGQVGMMILDEPTDGLDADNRRLAADVFRTLGQLARDRGHQVIVITHDEALQSAFDQRFVLEQVV